jgi:hypothetical protein
MNSRGIEKIFKDINEQAEKLSKDYRTIDKGDRVEIVFRGEIVETIPKSDDGKYDPDNFSIQ